ALDALRHALGIAEEIDHRQWMIQALYGLGNVHRDLYHYARGEEFLRRALAIAESIHSAVWINMVSGDLASLLVAQGDLDRADAILSALPPTMPMRTLGQRLVWSARAEFALAQREPEQALAIVDALYAATVTPAREEAIPRLALLKAEALAGVGQTERGMALIMSAIPTTESVDGLPRLYQLHATLARVASSTGKHDMAAEHVGIARRLIDHLASDLTSRDLVEQFTTGATALLGDDRLNRPATTTNSASGALTAREHEVATMIVEGLTNREIGDSLFVSTRTIETHVANILRKLGFTSRAQIAVWAVEHANHKATTT
ncbi:MAG TPA: helix-turn-helix transcriptional regulator, partial [Thermomicrobiales bacterium]|nr:helix-turn-helix transcriptional regulator [Thermomicrobiales bacterium]